MINISVNKKYFNGNVEKKTISNNWKLQYLDSNQVDFFAKLKWIEKDFELGNVKFKYYINSYKYIIFLICSSYFPKKLKVQKV